MPKLFTNRQRKPSFPLPSVSTGFCVSSYQEYVKQRSEMPDVSSENIKQLTTDFKMKISDPLKSINPDLEMGEYFVIVVDELRKMLDSGDEPEFLHVCNALRNTNNSAGELKTFPVAILIPIKKVQNAQGEESHEPCNSENTVFIESYPCPPDPRCPNSGTLNSELIFDPGIKGNDFQTLM